MTLKLFGKKKPKPAPQRIENDPNDPFHAGSDFQYLILPDFLRSRRIAWITAILATVLCIVLTLCLVLLIPLKKVDTIPILVDATTGYTKIVETGYNIDRPDIIETLDRYWLNRYMIALESYRPIYLPEYFEFVNETTCNRELNNYHWRYSTRNKENYHNLYKGQIINVRINAIHRTGQERVDAQGVIWRPYMVQFARDFRYNHEDTSGPPRKTLNYQALLSVRFQALKRTEKLIALNPLGFEVCNYERNRYTG